MTKFILGQARCDDCGQLFKPNESFGHAAGKFTHSPKCPTNLDDRLRGLLTDVIVGSLPLNKRVELAIDLDEALAAIKQAFRDEGWHEPVSDRNINEIVNKMEAARRASGVDDE